MTKYAYYLAAIPGPDNTTKINHITYLTGKLKIGHKRWTRRPIRPPDYTRDDIAKWAVEGTTGEIELNTHSFYFEERRLMML